MTENSGPGLGTLVGLRMAQVRHEADAQANEIDVLRTRLRRAQTQALYDQAFTLAVADVIAAVLSEFAGIQPRALSVSSAIEARNVRYAQLAAEHVKLLSNGRVTLSVDLMKRIVAERPLR